MRNLGVGSWIARRARMTPGRTAMIFEEQEWTFAQLHERITRLAHALGGLGVRHGDRVGYLGLNHPSFLETLFAANTLGAIFVPLNFRLAGPELEFVIGDAGCDVLVYGPDLAGLVDTIRDDLAVRHFVRLDTDYEALLEGQPVEPVDVPVDMDEVCLIMYTSGTTGRPKGAMLTHGNITWNNYNSLLFTDTLGDDVTLVCAPLFHIGGLNVTLLVALQKGATVVLMRAFDPTQAIELVQRYKVTTMFGVPAMFNFMTQVPAWAGADLSTIRYLICGGAPVPEPLIKTYLERGLAFCQGYGLTETAPFALLLDKQDALRKVGSAGKAPMWTEVRVVRPDMTDVEVGETGEVVIRGPNVMAGYWNRPEATDEVITHNGWFHSGDAARIDDEGYVYIVDRVKDMIISGGENIYPAEVEDVLYRHPKVAEVAIIGVPDERWGEVGKAIVVLKDAAECGEGELLEFCKGKVANYKIPKSVEFIDVLPRNPAGKVLKWELREKFVHL
jgi:fatty-acyl-CoA synthase